MYSDREKKAKDQQHSEEDPATNDSATEREADKTPSSASKKKKKKRKKRSTKERTEDLGDEAGGGGGEGIDNPAYDGSDGHQEEETTRVSKKRGSSKKHKSRLPKDIQVSACLRRTLTHALLDKIEDLLLCNSVRIILGRRRGYPWQTRGSGEGCQGQGTEEEEGIVTDIAKRGILHLQRPSDDGNHQRITGPINAF